MKKQFGRSMIEMLGVLAIVGILSIVGIAMYRRAVNNHQANTILDDVNRFAFVLTESNRAFSTNAFIDNIEYSKTSTYNLDAFLGASAGQFGIVVTDVPRGVCEPLVDKASVEYKVRTLPANTADSVVQLSATGLVYDVFHKDICVNDMNDVVLYFGDTSAQCNAPDEGETYAKCNSNAECCGGSFCWYPNDSDCYASGEGRCKSVSTFAASTIVVDGHLWTRTRQGYDGLMNWWSAQNWCTAQGLKPADVASVGCSNVVEGSSCEKSNFLDKAHEEWGSYCWLADNNSCSANVVGFERKNLSRDYRSSGHYALCH